MGATGNNTIVDDCEERENCCPDRRTKPVHCERGSGYFHVAGELVVAQDAIPEVFRWLEHNDVIGPDDRDCCCMTFEGCEGRFCIITVPHHEGTRSIPSLVDELRRNLVHLAEQIHPHYALTALPDAQWTPIAQPAPWRWPTAMSLMLEPEPGAKRVGVLDTGWFFRPNPTEGEADDPEKAGHLGAIQDWFGAHLEYEGELQPPDPDNVNPGDGHGPFVASIVLQEAPDAVVVARPVPSVNGFVTDCALARALCKYKKDFLPGEDPSIQPGVDVLNLSFGSFTHGSGVLPFTGQVIQSYFDHWFETNENPPTPAIPSPIIVASAGNNGSSQPMYPAALPSVVAVGALDDPLAPLFPALACWSNRGSWVHSYAPGTNVRGVYLTGPYEFDKEMWDQIPGECIEVPIDCTRPGGPIQGTLDFEGWAQWQGTSFASPFVAGRLAKLLAEEGMTNDMAVQAVHGMVLPS